MLVSPELSQEVDKQLAKAQEDIVQLTKNADKLVAKSIVSLNGIEISLKVGDVNLLVKRALSLRR